MNPGFLRRHGWWLLPVLLVGTGTLGLLLWGTAPEHLGSYTPW